MFLLLSLGLTQSIVGEAEAQADQGLTIRPAIIELDLDPKQVTTNTINFQNSSEDPLAVQVYVSNFIPLDEEIDSSKREQFDASKWIDVDKADHVLAPGQTKQLEITIEVPNKVSPGTHFAYVNFRILTLATAPTAPISIVPQLATTIIINIPGDTVDLLELDLPSDNQTSVIRNNELPISFTINNLGNVHQAIEPRVAILQNGQLVERLSLGPKLIVPNTKKQINYQWPANVNYGHYQYQIEFTYGSESIPLSSTPVDFRVVPYGWQLGLLGVIALALLFLAVKVKNIPNTLRVLFGKDQISKAAKLPAPSRFKRLKALKDRASARSSSKTVNRPATPRTTSETVDLTPPKPSESLSVLPNKPAKQPKRASKKQAPKPEKQTKTTIVQTPSTTIVREEAIEVSEQEPRRIKIKIIEDSTKPTKPPAKSNKKSTNRTKKNTKKAAKKTTKKSTTKKAKKQKTKSNAKKK